jgi:hypothetical protein
MPKALWLRVHSFFGGRGVIRRCVAGYRFPDASKDGMLPLQGPIGVRYS